MTGAGILTFIPAQQINKSQDSFTNTGGGISFVLLSFYKPACAAKSQTQSGF